jgi:hypothetical protein
MRRTVFEVAVAVAAAILVFALVALSSSWNPVLRWLLIGAAALVALAAAWLASQSKSRNATSGVEIGTGIRSGGGVGIEDIRVDPNSDNVRVGSDIKSRFGTHLRRITIGRYTGPRK